MAMNSLLFLREIKMSHLKTVCRTLFYQFFGLFVGLSIGFILSPEWVGNKQVLVERSIKNIFFPLKYNEQLEKAVKGYGAYKVYVSNGYPKEFEIIDECVYYNEEFYWCKYKYVDNKGNIKLAEDITRVRWKTWEYNYDYQIIDTPDKVKESLRTDKEEIEKRKLEIEKAKEKEKEILKKSQVRI